MFEVIIEKLGRQGDGIFVEHGKEIFAPYTLQGETVELSGTGQRRVLQSVVKSAGTRIEACCKHFEQCGGCQLQHMENKAYESWKTELLVDALEKVNISYRPDNFVSFPVSSRRKAVFSACRIAGALHFGFSKPHSDEIISLEECPVLTPSLQEAIPQLVSFASSLPLGSKPVRIAVLTTSNGLDVHVAELNIKAEAHQRALSRKALDQNFARLSFNDETIIEARKPILKMGKAMVVPAPGAFVQASAEVEEAMVTTVREHLSDAKKVADLYCGIGTFALRLAEQSQVWALEGSSFAIASLDKAWRNTAGELKQLTAEVRNLERRPVSFKELKKIEGLVFDPPRSGAELQSQQIAKSKVRKVAAVSCNPTTLARDISILLEGGYHIQKIVAFDQFRFTHHLETVVLLEK